MDVPEVVRLAGVPMPLRWSGAPLPVQLAEDALTITTGPRTDWFVDPAAGEVTATGSALLGAVLHREFTLTASRPRDPEGADEVAPRSGRRGLVNVSL